MPCSFSAICGLHQLTLNHGGSHVVNKTWKGKLCHSFCLTYTDFCSSIKNRCRQFQTTFNVFLKQKIMKWFSLTYLHCYGYFLPSYTLVVEKWNIRFLHHILLEIKDLEAKCDILKIFDFGIIYTIKENFNMLSIELKIFHAFNIRLFIQNMNYHIKFVFWWITKTQYYLQYLVTLNVVC